MPTQNSLLRRSGPASLRLSCITGAFYGLLAAPSNVAEVSHRPKMGQGDGEESRIADRQRARAGVEHDAAAKVLAALFREAPQTMSIREADAGRGLHFRAPGVAAARDHDVDLDLILVAVVPEAKIRISPPGLRDNLLDHERLQQVTEAFPLCVPVIG